MTIPKKKKGSFKKGLKTYNQSENDGANIKRKIARNKDISSDFPDEEISYLHGMKLRY